MSKNLERLLKNLKAEADISDDIYKNHSFGYKSNQRLVLKYGLPFLEIAAHVPLIGELGQCFENSLELLTTHPELHYTEGFANDDDMIFAVPHAWLIDDEGRVFDPTWASRGYLNSAYFGIVLTTEFVMEIVEKTNYCGILETDHLNNYQLKRNGFPPHALHPNFHPHGAEQIE